MDGVTDVNFAILMSKLGGLAVLHLEGVQTRYDNRRKSSVKLPNTPNEKVTALMQKIYSAPIKENLIGERIRAIKKAGAVCAADSYADQYEKIFPNDR